MNSLARRTVLLLVGTSVALAAGGCFAPREQIYSDVLAGRRLAYTRWRDQSDQEELPRLEGELSLADAVRVALAYNRALRQVEEEKTRARGQILEAYGEALPTVELSAGYTRLDEVITIDLGVSQFTIGSKDNWNYQVSITQPLFKGGAIPAAIRGAQLFRYLSDETVRQTVQDVILGVATAYYDVQLADQLYQVQQTALEFAEANLRDVLARKEQGVAIRYDVLRAQLEVSTVKADLIRQRNARSRALAALLRQMGVSQKSEVKLTDALTYEPMEPVFERAVEVAFKNRPEIFRDELNLRLQQEVLRGMRADYMPRLEAWGWHRWAKPDPHAASMIRWGTEWQAGLRLTWTLFDGLSREGRIIQQKATLRQSAITLSETEQKLLEEVKNAILDLADADELVRSQQLNLQQANEALRLVTVGAREGVNTELEMLDARSALTRARGLYYESLYAHVRARLALQRALGVLGPGPGQGDVPQEAPPLGVIKEFATTAPADGPALRQGEPDQQN